MNKKLQGDFGLIFWIHLFLILIFIISPFFFAWQWILLFVFVFILQDKFFKNCVLTKAQLRHRDDIADDELSFYAYYFKKMGIKINPKKVKKYFAWTLLWLVFIFSLFWQIDLGNAPLLLR